MFKLLKTGREYQKVAKAIGSIYIMLQDLRKSTNEFTNTADYKEDLLVMAYLSRREILDRIDIYNWNPEGAIFIPAIQKNKMTLFYALNLTVYKLYELAFSFDMEYEMEEIIEKKKGYYELEKVLPIEMLNMLK